MAAFETISKVLVQPVGESIDEEIEFIDLRLVKLPFDRPPPSDFDPRMHRDPKHIIKPWMAYFNILRSCVGAGMIGVPFAVSKAGILLGPFLMIGIGVLVAHTQTTMLWCLNEISRQLKIPNISYRYGFRLALLHGPPCLHLIGQIGPILIAVFMILSQLGICTVFVILTCDNLRDIMDWKSIVPALLWLIIPYLILEYGMKTLKIVSYISFFGTFLLALALALVFYAIMADPHGEVILITNSPVSFLLAFGTIMFNMSSVGVILSCEKALKDPKIVTNRYGVIQVGTMVPSLISSIFGVLGYWSFGPMEENVLRSLPYDQSVTLVTFGIYLVAITLAYPLQCYPGMQMLLEVIKNHDPLVTPDSSTMRVVEGLGRPLFVFTTFVIAYYVPFQAKFVAFVGNLCTSLLALVFPALMEIGLLYPDYYGSFHYLLIKDLLIVVIGIIMWIFGVWLSGAAFEAVSRTMVKTVDSRLEAIDVRTAHLPEFAPPMGDFDPRDHREPRVPISPWMAYFNMIRSSFGAGMLAMPMAISQVGIIMGPIMTLLVGILLTHTHLTLLSCLNEISRQLKIPYISYRYGFRMSLLHGPPILHFFGKNGPCLIALFMLLSQLSICTVFVILTTDNLRDMMDWATNEPALLVLFLPYLFLELFMKNLKIVSYVSMGGNVLNFIALLLVHIIMLMDPRKEVTYAAKDLLPMVVAFGIMLFNHSAVGVILYADKSLANPRILGSKIFDTGIVSVGILYPALMSSIFGALGYWCYGEMEENILRYLPFDDILTHFCFAFYLITVALTFPLQCYPGIQILLEVIKNHDPRVYPCDHTLKSVEYVSRPIFVASTFLIAYLVPFQGPFVAFVGNLCTNILAVIFPALMEIGLLYPDNYGRYDYILIKDLLIVFLGIVAWIVGIILCAKLIYIRIVSMDSPNFAVA